MMLVSVWFVAVWNALLLTEYSASHSGHICQLREKRWFMCVAVCTTLRLVTRSACGVHSEPSVCARTGTPGSHELLGKWRDGGGEGPSSVKPLTWKLSCSLEMREWHRCAYEYSDWSITIHSREAEPPCEMSESTQKTGRCHSSEEQCQSNCLHKNLEMLSWNVLCGVRWQACALFCWFVWCCRLTLVRCVLQPDEALSDDFLFPMTSRLSYASSPESDLDLSPEPRCAVPPGSAAPPPGAGPGPPRLVKSSSDPSIATQEDGGVPGYSAPPPYSASNHYRQVSVWVSECVLPSKLNSSLCLWCLLFCRVWSCGHFVQKFWKLIMGTSWILKNCIFWDIMTWFL